MSFDCNWSEGSRFLSWKWRIMTGRCFDRKIINLTNLTTLTWRERNLQPVFFYEKVKLIFSEEFFMPTYKTVVEASLNEWIKWQYTVRYQKNNMSSDRFCHRLRDLSCPPPPHPVFFMTSVTNYRLLYSTLLCKKIARAPGGHKKFVLTKLGGGGGGGGKRE